MEDTPMENGETNEDSEVAPALISVHPTQSSVAVAVAVGSDLRVFDLRGGCAVSLVVNSGCPLHKDWIRTIRYGADGKLFVSAGDDKTVEIWSTESWRCITTVCSEKRVSAVAISSDGSYVCFADKFGVVWVVDVDLSDGNQAFVDKKAAPLLSHYCSIITSLVTVFPKKPLDGAHEIQSFSLGHTEFVSCLAFVCTQECPQGFLVSGSGDSTDISSGSLLNTCNIREKAGLLESNGIEECHGAVTDLCTIPDSTLVAVAVQRQVVSIEGDAFIPTSLGTSLSSGLLWMVTGASNLHDSQYPCMARVKAISGVKETSPDSVEHGPIVLKDAEIPGGEKLLQNLQGRVSFDDNFFLTAAEALKTSMSNLLIKKQYSTENREFRKRTRNDKKLKQ
ncbi:hypothetical protein DVH24_002851 [Malus domestica]|uniref:Uncharacterized protein n=1 Tax=Malus domestica TaxID=3750 RepID=A0A498KB75_MALDO|nr:hypothetical protein DVH24_002851 [Malus domestica]